MPLTGVYGKGGSGKNTIATYLKLRYMKNVETYTNFPLRTPNTKQIDSLELFELPETDNPRFVIWDEAYTEGLDNRESMTLENRIKSYLLFQARKNNMSILAISQLQILDIRFEKLEEHIIHCKDRPIYNKDLTPCTKDFHYAFFNGKRIMPYTLKYYIAKKLFPFFKTKEKILPKDFDRLKMKLDMQDPKKRKQIVNETVKKILDIYPNIKKSDITHIWVKNAMFDLEIDSFILEPFIYLRLKAKL